MTFCQVILHKHLVDDIRADVKTSGTPGQPDYNVWYDRDSPNNKNPNWWNDKVVGHMKAHPEDPLPIPFNDPGQQRVFAVKRSTDLLPDSQSPKSPLSSTTNIITILR